MSSNCNWQQGPVRGTDSVLWIAVLTILLLGVVVLPSGAAEGAPLWKKIREEANGSIRYSLNTALCQKLLSGETNELSLPLPDGKEATFNLSSSGVMPPELSSRFPAIKSFSGVLKNNPQITAKIDLSPAGFRARISTPEDQINVIQAEPGSNEYISLARSSLKSAGAFGCTEPLQAPADDTPRLGSAGVQRGGRQLRTYRIAIAATGEFTRANGGTVQGALSTIVATLNQINDLYERELCIRLQLIPNTDKLIFLDPATDPYSANAANTTTILENQEITDQLIGNANYDIGHFFHTGEFGLAYISTVCRQGWKARGGIGTATGGNPLFFADWAAHEIAHQFGANHTFNSVAGTCAISRHGPTAYEPGSGSTMMGYSGFCQSDNLQPQNHRYFHSVSYDEIMRFVTTDSGANCAVMTPTGNNPPIVDAAPFYAIPKGTAFRLSAQGHDPDGDVVLYCWEQRDAAQQPKGLYGGDNGDGPLFRSMPPTNSPSRFFPRLELVLNNWDMPGETVPQVSRTLNFRVTARDNRGGIGTADTQVRIADSGPFRFTSHQANETYFGVQTITWDPAGTTAAPVSASHVNILLSTNGGASFDIVLAANTPNDGSERVLFPNSEISPARLRIEAVGNVFYAVNAQSFSIRRYFTVPDFNGDNAADLLWQNPRRQLDGWLLNGTNFLGNVPLAGSTPIPRGSRVAGLYDFNSDGRVDVLLQNANTSATVWYLNGTDLTGSANLREGTKMGTGWRIVSVGDFDADTQPDILWQHANRKLAVWKMNGSHYVETVSLNNGKPSNPGWLALAVGDFNSDAANDILFRHTTGRLAVWSMQGFEFQQNQLLKAPALPLAWNLGAMVDLDGNGQNDLVWNNTSGAIRIWYMSGVQMFKTGTLRNGKMPSTWRMSGPR